MSGMVQSAHGIASVDQSKFDPYKPDAGSGTYADGTFVQPVPDQRNVYTPWTAANATAWLKGLKNKPDIVAIDNEIEIAANTHQDMHPECVQRPSWNERSKSDYWVQVDELRRGAQSSDHLREGVEGCAPRRQGCCSVYVLVVVLYVHFAFP